MRSFALCLGLAVLAAGCGSAAGVDIPAPPPSAPGDPSAPADADPSDTAETPLSTGIDPSLVAPHPIAPASGATVTSTRPTLAWVVPAGLTGARVQICRDRACANVEREIEVTGAAARPRRPLAAGVHFYRLFGLGAAGHGTLASAAIPFTVRHRGASVDTSWGGAPDFDGDGRADLALTTQASPPRIAVHTAVGEPAIVEAAAASTGASYWIANAGDVDGDGFSDVLLGIPGERVDLYRGSPRGGLVLGSSLTSATPGFGSEGTGLGDVDRDGYADVAVLEGDHAVLYRGTSTGLVRGPSLASAAKVAPAGDVNGDGYADVLVVRTGTRSTVAILAGSATGLSPWPIVTLASPSDDDIAAASFGTSIACAGDLDGDGYADVAVAATSGNLVSPWRVHVYFGGAEGPAATPSTTIVAPVNTGTRGPEVAAAGDVSGDGFDDLLVGSPEALAGAPTVQPLLVRAALYFGSTLGPSSAVFQPFTLPALVSDYGGTFGSRVGTIGDVDGDGYADLVLGVAQLVTPGHARNFVFLHAGSAVGAWATPTTTLAGGDGDTRFGWSLAHAF